MKYAIGTLDSDGYIQVDVIDSRKLAVYLDTLREAPLLFRTTPMFLFPQKEAQVLTGVRTRCEQVRAKHFPVQEVNDENHRLDPSRLQHD